ncbi:MAG: hypothetical protein FWG20_01010 [Candidatus Cloacimonetes bacterium]|nr:hypothetical protein [Candidatus Cloacimonadota bacterium]
MIKRQIAYKNNEWFGLFAQQIITGKLLIWAFMFMCPVVTIYADDIDIFTTEADSLNFNFAETVEMDSLYYESDFLDYLVEKETIFLKGSAKVTYGTSIITADSIAIDFSTNQATAYGHIVMEDLDQLFLGSSAYYDIQSQKGIVTDGASRFELGYYYGDEIRKVGDNVFDVDDGRFTTCDAKHPHFDFRSHTMRVYRDHMVVAKPIIFYVNDFPIFALPYGSFSIKRGRVSGFLMPSPGWSQGDGKYLDGIGYFYVINDYADMTASMDLKEKTGYNYRFELLYLDRYKYRGNLDVQYRYRLRDSYPDVHYDDWSVRYRHFQNLPEKATFDVDIDYKTSREVSSSEADPNKRLQEYIRSSVSYRKPFKTSSFASSGSYTENLITDEKNIVLPSFSYSMPSKPVHEFFPAIPDSVRRQNHWWKTFSFNWGTAGIHTGRITDHSPSWEQIIYKNEKDSLDRYVSEHHAGMRQNATLSWNYTALRFLKLNNSLSYQDAVMDRDKTGKTLVHGYSYSTNSSASFTLYGMSRHPSLPITAVRHIVTPSASFRFSPDFSDQNKNFYSFGGIGVSAARKTRMIGLSLDQRWQFRLKPDSEGNVKTINDLLSLRTSSGYNLEAEKRPWSDISQSATFNPGNYDVGLFKFQLSQNYSATQQAYNHLNVSSWRVSTTGSISGDAVYHDYFPLLQNDFITGNYFPLEDSLSIMDQQIRTINDMEKLDKPGNWSLTPSHEYSYDRIRKQKSQRLNTSTSAKLTTHWTVSHSLYYDLQDKRLMSQNYNITRDLHCWKILFTYTTAPHFWQYSLLLYNIKLPELKVKNDDNSR